MSLYPYTITAIAKNTTASSNIVAGAAVSLLNSIGSPVTMYDNAEGSNGSTGKAADSRGQVTVYVEQGEYSLNVNGTASGKFTVISNLSTINVDTFANLELLTSTTTGQVFECQERANASYILKDSSYVALAGDATLASGRVAAIQVKPYAVGGHFGVLDNGLDVSVQFNAFVARLKLSGLHGVLAAGTYLARNIRLESGTKKWSFTGAGKGVTLIRSTTGEGTTIIGTAGSTVGYKIGGFTLDCRYGELSPSAANHGISVADTNDVVFDDIDVIDYKNTAILVNSTSENNTGATISNSTCNGNTVAGNGFLIVSYEDAEINGSRAINVRGTEGTGPAYGLQFKNKCTGGRIINSSAKNCTAGVAFGFEGSSYGCDDAVVVGCYAEQCEAGLQLDNVKNANISMVIDQESAGESAINMEDGSEGNLINATVRNIANSKGAVRFRDGSLNNSIEIAVQGLGSGSAYGIFDNGSLDNIVNVKSHKPADFPNNGYRSVTSFNSTTTNSLVINGVPAVHTFLPLVSGIAAVNNRAYKLLKVDTQSAASADDMTGFSGDFKDGQVISITCASNSRAVTVKNSGNIITLNAGDLVLNDRNKIFSFIYVTASSKFSQI